MKATFNINKITGKGTSAQSKTVAKVEFDGDLEDLNRLRHDIILTRTEEFQRLKSTKSSKEILSEEYIWDIE